MSAGQFRSLPHAVMSRLLPDLLCVGVFDLHETGADLDATGRPPTLHVRFEPALEANRSNGGRRRGSKRASTSRAYPYASRSAPVA